eukprot:CAMPEP_0204912628 /NCGR_PEP_ID=MMETSP1397-20131031/10744_1 /ASSEMBLY_ACC=CAM_ASM_000891 /TAXON_ID=49980 /ORGANISM="Climacostomum Climacostomum virens, Strain Stock W-24" /LENGTH=315 /DNA_ID=CAMNT_0052083645 /DNA_START=267 /DNA_END=1211 /DNA_ORIENTATION=-
MLRHFKNFGSCQILLDSNEFVPKGCISGLVKLNLNEQITVEKLQVSLSTSEMYNYNAGKSSRSKSYDIGVFPCEVLDFTSLYFSKGKDSFRLSFQLPESFYEDASLHADDYKLTCSNFFKVMLSTNKGELYYTDLLEMADASEGRMHQISTSIVNQGVQANLQINISPLRLEQEATAVVKASSKATIRDLDIQLALRQEFTIADLATSSSTSAQVIGQINLSKERPAKFRFKPNENYQSHPGLYLKNEIYLDVQVFKKGLLGGRYHTERSFPLTIKGVRKPAAPVELLNSRLAPSAVVNRLMKMLLGPRKMLESL